MSMTLGIGLRHLHASNAWCKKLPDSEQQIEGIDVRIKRSMALMTVFGRKFRQLCELKEKGWGAWFELCDQIESVHLPKTRQK
jgi:hypothetical protein